LTQVGEVRWRETVKCFKRQQAQLELDTLLNRKPVEAVPQYMTNVAVLLGAVNICSQLVSGS